MRGKRTLKWLAIVLVAAFAIIYYAPEMLRSMARTSQNQQETTETASQVAKNVWPMPIEDFVRGNYLQHADILLTRRDYDPVSFSIRSWTGSHFSHAAMVFAIAGIDPGVHSVLLIESTVGGVDITKLESYLKDKSTVVAIKRVNRPWFNQTARAQVRGEMLEKIDAGYGYGIILDHLRTGAFAALSALYGSKNEAINKVYGNEVSFSNNFICSGFIQYGYLKAITKMIENGQMPLQAVPDVLFDSSAVLKDKYLKFIPLDYIEQLPPEERPEVVAAILPAVTKTLESQIFDLTPMDLAESKNSDWLYLIKDGLVHEITSKTDIEKMLQ